MISSGVSASASEVDAEGAELLVLRGARSMIEMHRPVLLLEHDDSIAEDAAYSLADVATELVPFGYELFALRSQPEDLRLYRPNAVELSAISGLLFTPRSMGWPQNA